MKNQKKDDSKTLNEMAVETFTQLLALPDKEFFEYFDKIKPSDLSQTLFDTNLVQNHNSDTKSKEE